MKTKLKLTTLSLITSALLIGCGNSSSSDNTSTGYFIDSPVSGCSYTTSSGLSGTTDEYGRFEFQTGDTVKFTLGKLILGESKPDTQALITPTYLIAGEPTEALNQDEESQVTLLLQTLQSLDNDDNLTNGILIEPDVITSLDTMSSEIQIKDANESVLIELENKHNLGLDKDNDGHLDVNATEAKQHFEDSKTKFIYNHIRPDDDNYRNQYQQNRYDNQYTQFDINNYPTSTLSDALRNALAYMGNEERLAHDVYINLYNYHLNNNSLNIMQLNNIATKSETNHISIVQSLVTKYSLDDTNLTTDANNSIIDINNTTITKDSTITDENVMGVYKIQAIQDLYNTLYNLGITNQEAALKVGCMVEVTDINDLDKYITLAQDSNATDIEEAFKILRDGSYNHYWSFDKGLKNLGITNGCYYQDDPLLTDKTNIYPK